MSTRPEKSVKNKFLQSLSLFDQNEMLLDEKEMLEADLANLKETLRRLTYSRDEQIKEVNGLKAEIQNQCHIIGKYKNSAQEEKQKYIELEMQNNKLNAKLFQFNAALKSTEEWNDILLQTRNTHDESLKELKVMQSTAAELQIKNSQVQEELDQTKDKLSQVARQLEEREKHIAEIETQSGRKSDKITQMEAAVVKSAEVQCQLNQANKALAEENAILRKDLDMWQEKASNASKEIETLRESHKKESQRLLDDYKIQKFSNQNAIMYKQKLEAENKKLRLEVSKFQATVKNQVPIRAKKLQIQNACAGKKSPLRKNEMKPSGDVEPLKAPAGCSNQIWEMLKSGVGGSGNVKNQSPTDYYYPDSDSGESTFSVLSNSSVRISSKIQEVCLSLDRSESPKFQKPAQPVQIRKRKANDAPASQQLDDQKPRMYRLRSLLGSDNDVTPYDASAEVSSSEAKTKS